MADDNNQNQQQQQQKQKGGGGGQQREGISISQSWSAGNPGSIANQMKVAFINGMAYAAVPLIGGFLAKAFDAAGQKLFGVKPAGPAPLTGKDVSNNIHSLYNNNPDEAVRVAEGLLKRAGKLQLPEAAPEQADKPVTKPQPAPKQEPKPKGKEGN